MNIIQVRVAGLEAAAQVGDTLFRYYPHLGKVYSTCLHCGQSHETQADRIPKSGWKHRDGCQCNTCAPCNIIYLEEYRRKR